MKQQTPFDTEDLEKEIEESHIKEDIEMNRISNNPHVVYWNDKVLNAILKERQRLAKEVRKAIDKMLAEGLNGQRYNFLINGENLKQKLGLSQEKK